MPSNIIIHHWSIAYELVSYWSLLRYFSVATVTITTKLLPLLFATVTLFPNNFAEDIKSFKCGWIENSAANTWEYSLTPLVLNQ